MRIAHCALGALSTAAKIIVFVALPDDKATVDVSDDKVIVDVLDDNVTVLLDDKVTVDVLE